ncbi:Acetyl-coenzyme A synthetase [Microbulbifer aggregans]|uniref:Acetyl-coenzyme A synthetase n=1 Tax=Microbulbifer aggregans TaxID=1769779 RepID=A0A1C9W9V4_9GAMM|nr:acetate--CoA ligase [Microbulbifer aggregans]AOS97948.1 Acetyl-coenzyme A synthetase [Microbulbifer aggregans]
MSDKVIAKRSEDWELIPNLLDYGSAREHFTWEHERELLQGGKVHGLNIGYEAVDRHANGERRNHVALRWLDRDGAATDITYGDLQLRTNRFANVLQQLGVGRSERVFALLGRVPALYETALGTLKSGSVFSPLFSAFGPEPLQSRLSIGDAKVLVTNVTLYKRKVAPIRNALPQLEHVILVREAPTQQLPPDTRDFNTLMDAAAETFSAVETAPDDPALLHFTSGTTGKPKGAIHVHEAVLAHHASARLALDLHPQDVFWCTADPGWVTGTSYGIIAPLTIGATMIVDCEEFEPERWYGILRDHKVSVWYTAPTAVRMMMKQGAALAQKFDLPALRFMASVGEPLNPEAVVWGMEAFGLPFHDNWWQTETGGIMIANFLSQPVRPGSMGRPLPGIEAAIVDAGEDGSLSVVEESGKEGELALRRGWPSMFRGYLHEEERYRRCFRGDWYLTGDLARMDDDGYFWFVGRADDVIKSAGHLIGPFEVESALMEHPSVAEAAVIGMPDPVAMEIVKAFVSLKPGVSASEDLQRELLAFTRKRLGPAVAPREIAFRDNLPRTRSGKIMRRLLKARELGLPEGDTSTLEGGK